MRPPDQNIQGSTVARVGGVLSAALGLFVLAGWVLGVHWMKSGLPGAVEMKANTSVGMRLVITDMHMAGMDGLAFVRVLKQMLPEAKIIVTNGRLDEFETAEFKALGVIDMIAKPFTHEKLVKILQTTFMQQAPSESGHTQPKLTI